MLKHNLLYLLIVAFSLIECSSKHSLEQRYPFKSGKIIFENKMGQNSITQTLYFEDYGNKETIVSEIDMNGDQVILKSVYLEDYCYTSTSTSDKVNRTKIDRDKVNHLGFFTVSPGLLAKDGFYEGQEDIISGKLCKVYSIKKEDYDMRLWVWDHVIMQLVSTYRGTVMKRTVTSLEEIEKLPASLFDVPE